MNYKIIVSKDAGVDVDETMGWYEKQSKGLGIRYLASVTDCFKLLVKNPFAFAKIYLQIRKINTAKFPYSLYYYINEQKNEVTVFAVIHKNRNDDTWKKRVT